MSWQSALDWVATLNVNGGLCDKTDWRLLNIVELGLLPNKEKSDSDHGDVANSGTSTPNVIGFPVVDNCSP